MAKQQYFHRVEAEGQHNCRAEHAANHGCRQTRHQDALGRKRAEQRDVEDGRRDQPFARPRTPQIPTFARDIEDRLTAVHQRNNRQRAQGVSIETEDKAPDRKAGDTEGEIAESQDDTGDGEITHSPDIRRRRRPTLSVADDSAKKSPATIIITISNGVSMAVPEMTRPASKKRT